VSRKRASAHANKITTLWLIESDLPLEARPPEDKVIDFFLKKAKDRNQFGVVSSSVDFAPVRCAKYLSEFEDGGRLG
jgi:hypothetical protein